MPPLKRKKQHKSMTELLHDTNFWVLISFIIFMGVAWVYGRHSAMASLDKKINDIRLNLNQAERLRVESQELLAEYQRKHKDALSEAESIIAEARKNSDLMREKADNDLDRLNDRRQKQLDDRLKRIEDDARQDVSDYITKIVLQASKDILTKNIDSKSDKAIINNVMDNFPKTLN